MADLLQQLPNGGAVVAIIVVVVIFLKRQERYEDRLEGVVKLFTAEIAQGRRDYLDSLERGKGRRPPT